MEIKRDIEGVFYYDTPLHFYDCDYLGRLKLSALLRYLADIAGIDYTLKGYSHEFLWEHGMVFLIAGESIRFRRVPRSGETLTFATWERGVKGPRYLRDFAVLDAQGSTVIEASSVWLLANPETRKILRPDVYDFHMTLHPELAADVPPVGKLSRGKELAFGGVHEVRYSDMDGNGHVYNAKYADFAYDAMEQRLAEREPTTFRINWDSEATLGDEVSFWFCEEGNTLVCAGKKPDGTLCFECEVGYC